MYNVKKDRDHDRKDQFMVCSVQDRDQYAVYTTMIALKTSAL